MTHSVPLFLVNGNHDGELGWLLNGSNNALPVWATSARQTYFANPKPDGFYLGDTLKDALTGDRASWYAWQWGDALFVVLDPYWSSPAQSSKDGWNLTLGDRQYQWLAKTLADSQAKHKMIFIHLVGIVIISPYFICCIGIGTDIKGVRVVQLQGQKGFLNALGNL